VTHDLIFGLILLKRLVPEDVKRVIASVNGMPQHVQLKKHRLSRKKKKHRMVCDVPPYGLINDDLCPEQDPPEAIHCILRRWLGAFANQETYGSSGQITKYCRDKILHLAAFVSGRFTQKMRG
jgi:hypothetical protein